MSFPKTRRVKINGECTGLELFLREKLGHHMCEEIPDEELAETVNGIMRYHGSRE